MGMFNNVEVEIPLPGLPAAFEPNFQTKDLEPNVLDRYRIDAAGVLWHQDYTIEDRSDPTATGLLRWAGAMTKVPTGWSKVDHTGEVRFYDNDHDTNTWYEYSCYFEHGVLVRGPNRIEDR